MTEYRVNETCFFNGSLYRKGDKASLPATVEVNEYFDLIDPKKPDPTEQAAPTLSIMHKGRGMWAVVNDTTGEEIESGLTKIEAQIFAGEGLPNGTN